MREKLIEKSNLDSRIKRILKVRCDINTLDELVSYDYQKLRNIRGLGVESLEAIKNYVHQEGYSLLNENGPFSSKEEELVSLGLRPLSSYSLEEKVCFFLYRNNIFTLADLVQYGTLVYKLDGFTKGMQEQLKKFLMSLNVILEYHDNYSKRQLIRLRNNEILPDDVNRVFEKIQLRELDELEYRTRRILDLHDIKTLKDLLMVDKKEIKGYRNMGNISYEKLASYFLEFNIFLRDDEKVAQDSSNRSRQIRLLKMKKELIMKYQLSEIWNRDNQEDLKSSKGKVRVRH